jgi:predicted TIM-barrel fold metal-dependent hydrolase
MIVDTAVHYLEGPRPDRPYDPDGSPPLVCPIEEAIKEATEVGIDALVQMSPSTIGFDQRYNLECAVRYPDRVLGVFCRFNPIGDDVAERLKKFKSQQGVLGIRILFREGKPSERWLAERALDPFLTAAQEQGVAVSCYPAAPLVLRDTARRFPGIRFIAEHSTLAPAKRVADPFVNWSDVLVAAAEPNIWMQCSYFTEAAPTNEKYPFPTGQRRFKELYESVGPSRLIWGAHFPLIRNLCTYKEALDLVRVECDFLTEKDRKAILGDNFVAAFAPPARK